MRVRREFPRPVRTVEHAWIELPDGCRLAARMWLPEDAESAPAPAVLDAVPYRKGDGTAARDATRYPYIAGHGYACVRLDLRGSGDSDGLIADEYTEQEQDDVEAVIAWLASQPWCDGSVGMIGASWGGFAALQAAARNPPALRGIVAIHASDDRYADDVPRDRKGRRMSGATRPNRGSGDAGVGERRALKGCTDCRGNLSTLHASGSRPPVQR